MKTSTEPAPAKVPEVTLGFCPIGLAQPRLTQAAAMSFQCHELGLPGRHTHRRGDFPARGCRATQGQRVPAFFTGPPPHHGRHDTGRFAARSLGIGTLVLRACCWLCCSARSSSGIATLAPYRWARRWVTGWPAAGIGHTGAAVVFHGLLASVAAACYRTTVSRTLLFWVAFMSTRPLGAVVGGLLNKPLGARGLALSRYSISAALLAFMLTAISVCRHQPARMAH